MGNLLFLLIAIVLSAVGILIVWARHRGPSGVYHGVDSFNVIVTDETGRSDTILVRVNVTSVNDAPMASSRTSDA